MALDLETILKEVAPFLSGGMAGDALALASDFSAILRHYLLDSPEKLAKAQIDLNKKLLQYAMEAGNASGKDVSNLTAMFNQLLMSGLE